MGDDTPVLEEVPRSPAGVAAPATGEGEGEGADRNNRGNFTRNLNKEPDAQVARKMFLGGLALLPWLHFVNVWFFRRQFTDATVDPKVTLCEFLFTFVSERDGDGGELMVALLFFFDRGAPVVPERVLDDGRVPRVVHRVPAQVEGLWMAEHRHGRPGRGRQCRLVSGEYGRPSAAKA